MAERIDVLAVMDRNIATLEAIANGYSGNANHRAVVNEAREARAAVADLIEAANRTIRYADSEPDGDQVVEVSRANIRDLRAAVALAGGASHG